MKIEKEERYQLFLLLGLSFFLRFIFLGAKTYWADELWAVALTEHGLKYIWNYITFTEINPPFFYYLVKLWRFMFGPGEFALRTLPAFFGSVTPEIGRAHV